MNKRLDWTVPGLLRVTAVLALASAASACSTLSDVGTAISNAGSDVGSAIASVDPTGLLGGGDSTPAPDQTAAAPPSDANTGTTPDLAALPAAPKPDSTPAQNQQTAQSLSTDRSQAQYSADVLRGGTEAAAPPPPPATGLTQAQIQQAQQAAAAPPPAAAAAPPPAAPVEQVASATPAPAPMVAAAAPPPGVEPAVPINAPPTAVASLGPGAAPPPGAEPAVPMNAPPTAVVSLGSGAASDAALGFKPSSAPPLDPSISQWVSAPIIAHYQQTAARAGIAAAPIAATSRSTASGAVVANLDTAQSNPANVYTNMDGGTPPTAVILFPGDGTTLNAAALAKIHDAVTAFKAAGGQGAIRVVGHASSRTANMPVDKHLMVIFQKSQARATAVAKELIREGVPADKVLPEAVGDSQPVYYESMPQGEDGNRRAEIFVQG